MQKRRATALRIDVSAHFACELDLDSSTTAVHYSAHLVVVFVVVYFVVELIQPLARSMPKSEGCASLQILTEFRIMSPASKPMTTSHAVQCTTLADTTVQLDQFDVFRTSHGLVFARAMFWLRVPKLLPSTPKSPAPCASTDSGHAWSRGCLVCEAALVYTCVLAQC